MYVASVGGVDSCFAWLALHQSCALPSDTVRSPVEVPSGFGSVLLLAAPRSGGVRRVSGY